MSRNAAITALVCVLLAAGLTGTAFAHSSMSAISPGAGAEASSPHAAHSCGGNHARVRITDLKDDGHPVKVEFYRGTAGPYSITEARGQGHTTWSGCGARISRIRACTVIPWRPDRCSAWVS
jgi:hypothetical protein